MMLHIDIDLGEEEDWRQRKDYTEQQTTSPKKKKHKERIIK